MNCPKGIYKQNTIRAGKMFLALMAVILFNPSLAQTERFSKTYHYEIPDDTARTEGIRTLIEIPGEGYMFINNTWNYYTGNSKYIITKIDLEGNAVFAKAYGDSGYQYASESIEKTSDNNFIININKASYSIPGNNLIGGLIKVTPSGDTLWSKYYTSGLDMTALRRVIETTDGGFVLVGWTADDGGNSALYLIKTDNTGNKLWAKQYGGSLDEDTRSIIETPDKGFLIAGWTTSYGAGGMDGYLIKTDSLGNQQWQKTYGTGKAESIATIISLADGNYLLTGEKCLGPGTNDNIQGWLIKVSPTGTIIWEKNYGTPLTDGFFAAKELNDGSIIASGNTYDTTTTSYEGWLIKLTNAGDTIWSRVYGYPYYKYFSDEYFFDVVPTQDGGFITGGFCIGPTLTQDAWVLKVDSMGCDTAGCHLVGINELKPENMEFVVYPNPANDLINILICSGKSYSQIELALYDISGRKLLEKTLSNLSDNILNLENYSTGMYFLQFFRQGKIISHQKLIINH